MPPLAPCYYYTFHALQSLYLLILVYPVPRIIACSSHYVGMKFPVLYDVKHYLFLLKQQNITHSAVIC